MDGLVLACSLGVDFYALKSGTNRDTWSEEVSNLAIQIGAVIIGYGDAGTPKTISLREAGTKIWKDPKPLKAICRFLDEIQALGNYDT